MNTVDFYFVDEGGNHFPCEEESGDQHIRQYADRWRVHVNGEWDGRVAIDHDPRIYLVPASVSGEWELSQASSEILRGVVGSLSVLLLDSSGQPIGSKCLQIQPANVSWNELEQMLGDIGLMALLSTSCTQADVRTPIQEDTGLAGIGSSVGIGYGPLRTASSLIALYEALRYSWPAIQQHPLKSIVSKPGVVRLDQARSSPALMIKRRIEPSRMTSAGLVIEEDTSCSENEFLTYLLDHYLVNLAKEIITLLRSAEEQVAQASYDVNDVNIAPSHPDTPGLNQFFDSKRQRTYALNSEYENYKEGLRQKITELEAIIQWASAARSSSFLKKVSTPAQLPTASLRLTHSPHYGPVYAKFVQCEGTSTGGLKQVLYLLECIQKHRIRPAWNIYELWCLVKLYTMFERGLRLRPRIGEPSLFERVRLTDGEISLPTNTPFQLTGRFGGRKVEVELWYEKQYLEHLTYGRLIANPDIVIKIGVNGSFSEFCFDAKYRNYSSQGVTTFINDVYTRAYQKYQQQLHFKGGFILHTDRTVDYWGEVKIGEFLNERFHSGNSPTTDPAKHRYGAVSLRPGADVDRQFKKLMQLLFHYHGSLRDTCLNCGCRLQATRDMQHDWKNDPEKYYSSDEGLVKDVINNRRDWKGTGIYCFCPRCGNFWVIQHCRKQSDLLVKTMPKFCLHRRSIHPEYRNGWMYICPVCCDDPSPEELGGRNGDRNDQ